MKTNTLHQTFKSTLVAGLAASSLWGFQNSLSANPAGSISIDNFSFENDNADPLGNPDDDGPELDFFDHTGWTSYFEEDFDAEQFSLVTGTLFANYDIPGIGPSTWFEDETPHGNRVLFLFTNTTGDGNGYFGVEKELATIEGGCRYTLTVDVGNPATSLNNDTNNDPDDVYDLNGFPIYRIQVFAGDLEVPLAQDFASLNIEEGRFETSTLIIEIREDSPFVGQPLRIRLQNENNDLGIASDPRAEVDFDNIRLTTEPYSPSSFYFATGSPEKIDIASPIFSEDNPVEINFDIVGGTKSIFAYGRGISMDSTAENIAIDPAIRIINRDTGAVVAESNDWWSEDQSGGIIDFVDMMSYAGTHQFMQGSIATDAALMITLDPGEYVAQLSSQGEQNVYAGIKIFERALGSNGSISFPTEAELEFKQVYVPRTKYEAKKKSTQPTTKRREVSSQQTFEKK